MRPFLRSDESGGLVKAAAGDRPQAFARYPAFCVALPQRRRGCCADLKRPLNRPDLATYSQREQLALGAIPSWNSPDITTNNDIPWQLMSSAQVVVRNLSPVASAVNALVHVHVSAFGIGAQRSPLGSRQITLGPGSQTEVDFPFPQSILGGDPSIGVHVTIEHPYDQHLLNNRGSQVLRGVLTSGSGRTADHTFPVVNASDAIRTFHLSVLATPLTATVTPAAVTLNPWQQVQATLHVSVPAALHGTSAAPSYNEVTVAAFEGGSLIDGATHIVWVDD